MDLWVTFLSGCFGLLTATVVVWLTQKSDREKRADNERRWRLERQAEYRRWYSERLVQRKFDGLTRLHAALVDCHFAMTFYLSVPPPTREEFNEKIQSKEESYLMAFVMANGHLSEEQRQTMRVALGKFRKASRHIFFSLPAEAFTPSFFAGLRKAPEGDPWDGFEESYEAAKGVLEKLLDPDSGELADQSRRMFELSDTDTDTR